MKITNADLIALRRGINLIDGGYNAVIDGKTIGRSFKLGAPVRLALARIGVAIKPALEAYDVASKALFAAQHPETYTTEKGEPAQRVPASQLAAYTADLAALLAAVADVRIGKYRMKVSALNVGSDEGQNAIPTQALIDLNPVLVDDAPAAEGAQDD